MLRGVKLTDLEITCGEFPMKTGFTIMIGVGKDKKLVVLEHFILIWHIIRTFKKIIMFFGCTLTLQPGKSKFGF